MKDLSVRDAVPPCTSPELQRELHGYVLGRLEEEQRGPIEAHVAGCARCASRLDGIVAGAERLAAEASAAGRAPRRIHRALVPALVAAAAIAAIVLVSRPLVGPPRLSEPVRRALALGALPRAAVLDVLVDEAPALADVPGTESVPGKEPSLHPSGTVVRDARPAFRWTPAAEAGATYEVTVAGPDGAIVSASGPLHEASWTPASPLPRGIALTWQVRIHAKEEERVLPAPDAPRARLLALDDAGSAALDRALERAGASALARAVALSENGLVEEARAELVRAAATTTAGDTDHEALDRLLAAYGLAPTTAKPAQ